AVLLLRIVCDSEGSIVDLDRDRVVVGELQGAYLLDSAQTRVLASDDERLDERPCLFHGELPGPAEEFRAGACFVDAIDGPIPCAASSVELVPAVRMSAIMAAPLEQYGVIGDTTTVALVSRTGSIDWLCMPRIDSDACFAQLLGTNQNGYWSVRPA